MHTETHPSDDPLLSGLSSPLLLGTALGALTLGAIYLIYPVLLALLCGIVIAVIFDGLGRIVAERLPISRRVAIAGLLLLWIVAMGILGAQAGPALMDQAAPLLQTLQEATDRLRALPTFLAGLPPIQAAVQPADAIQAAGQLLPPLASALTAGGAMIFIGAYLALAPQRYVQDATRLLHPDARLPLLTRVEAGYVGLRGWLLRRLARGILLTGVGLLVAILADLPAPVLLAALLGASPALPILGPLVATALTLAVVAERGPAATVQVMGVWIGLQALVAYKLPPSDEDPPETPAAILLPLQACAWTLTGWMGVVLTAPVMVALTQMAAAPPPRSADRS